MKSSRLFGKKEKSLHPQGGGREIILPAALRNQKLIHFVLLFFGATFLDAGVLMMHSNLPVGIGSVLIGLFLGAKPIFHFTRLARESFGGVAAARREWNDKKRRHQERSGRESDERPTYH